MLFRSFTLPVAGPAVLAALGAIVGLGGCSKPAAPPPPSPPEVTVAKPLARHYEPNIVLTGILASPQQVAVRARVTGYLDKVAYTEGTEVKVGDLLFQIDARPFQAEVDRATADQQRAEAQRDVAAAEYARAEKVGPSGVVSAEELGKRRADLKKADADVIAAKAALESARINLEFTSIRSPINGRTSAASIKAGNLIVANSPTDPPLTTVVQTDTVHFNGDLDENQVLSLMRSRPAASAPRDLTKESIPVGLAIGGETGFPHEGRLDFIDNQIRQETGTLRIRGLFPNADGKLIAGSFGRMRVAVGGSREVLFVDEKAVASDQDRKFVYVVGPDGRVEYRRVRLGPTEAGLVLIEEGLNPADRVIINGLLRARPGALVTAIEQPMPTPPVAGAPAAKPAAPAASATTAPPPAPH